MYTHPASTPPSTSDFNSAYSNGYQNSIILCHDSKIFAIKSEQYVQEELCDLIVAEYLKAGYNEYKAQLAALKDLTRNFKINFMEV